MHVVDVFLMKMCLGSQPNSLSPLSLSLLFSLFLSLFLSLFQVRMIRTSSRDNPEPPLPYLKISGGIFHDMLCHDFDMHHFITGEVYIFL